MKKLLQLLGRVLFWAGWPYWYFYFRANNRRSRVLVVVDSEILVLKAWLGTGTWGLPGGGAHRDETLLQSAVRELQEEIGYPAAESALRVLGKQTHKKAGLSYRASHFALELTDKPELQLQKAEISEAKWIEIAAADQFNLDDDVRFAIRKYQPLDQTELL